MHDALQPNRLARGGLLDRSQALSFRFDGRGYGGFAGDTLASALLAANVRLLGRSFKYHRPRGLLTAGSEEPNALVELRTGARREPNTRATMAELYDGLEANSQNRWPSLAFDLGALASLVSPMLPAGFYYKTFMWPRSWWERVYEPAIRRAAGLGHASHEPDPDRYEKSHLFCDVLVIGSGPAGLAAALAASRGGARVVLCEEDFSLGGRLLGDRREIDGVSGVDWARAVEAELQSMPQVTLLRRTTVFGAYDGGSAAGSTLGARTFGALERVADHLPVPPPHQPRQRLWKIIARRTVLAAGATERPIVFGDNDRPGVMLASAVRTYVNRFGVTPGRRIALFTATDNGWQTAIDLSEAGVAVEVIVDVRLKVNPALQKRCASWGTRMVLGGQVVQTTGARELGGIIVLEQEGARLTFEADTLAVSGGWTPNLALSTHLGGRPSWYDNIGAFVPADIPSGMAVVGAARGALSLAEALLEGSTAGAQAAATLGFRSEMTEFRPDDDSTALRPFWFVKGGRGKAFVDLQNDVTSGDIALAAREGFDSVELLKRYTTLGMATDQGKTSSATAHAILASIRGRPIAELGTTSFRPPYTPVAIGAFAGTHRGKHFKPTRLTPAHAWAVEQGATFMEAGEWLRAQWFARPGETDWMTTVTREVNAVRNGVGVCDVSTLGKIDIRGAGAGEFLDRVYANMFSPLPVGKTRYGVMLREDGFVMDDGTTARLDTERFVMSTTTANAGKVMQHLEFVRQVVWPQTDVQLASVSEHWAQFAIAGPRSRRVLERLLDAAVDVSDAALPYLGCLEFAWGPITARLFRISFSGELAYELAVPARYGDATIRAIMAAGEPDSITPYGLESLGVMRIEKGHVAGAELSGTTTADDLGLGRLMSAKKDYIGAVLAKRPALTDSRRDVLVGLHPVDPRQRLYGGAHFLEPGAAATLENDLGYVTSVAYSPTLGHWIGLGLLSGGRERIGARLRAHDPVRKGDVDVQIVSPVFVDPEGSRLRG